jgi:type IV secretory pathway VirB9-like protein
VRQLVLLLLTTTTACTVNSGVKTTPTFVAARQLPQTLQAPDPEPVKPAANYAENYARPGAATIMAANRDATVDPTGGTMQGASWVIGHHDPSQIYRVPVTTRRVTTLLLPSGEKFNSAIAGDLENFVINVAYAGPRPAVSILPKQMAARGNLQLATTGGLYSFDIVTGRTSVNLVDIGGDDDGPGKAKRASQGQVEASVEPQGDFTRLSFSIPSGEALPAWAPTEAWADSFKMVVRFQGPLPVLPALFAGGAGEQIVNYRTVVDQGSPTLVTTRRITEGELRLDDEVLRITAKEAPADTNPHGWRQAGTLPAQGGTATPNVAVFVMPGMDASAVQDAGTLPEPAQPMANHLITVPGI